MLMLSKVRAGLVKSNPVYLSELLE